MAPDITPKNISATKIEQIMSDILGVQDRVPLELFRKLKFVSQLMNNLIGEYHKDDKLTPARMRLLVRLGVSSQMGNDVGLTPSDISQYLGVSRNTVSALLSGLEDQKLIERTLHPADRRQFLIRLSSTGHELIRARAPGFATFVTGLFGELTPTEQETLSTLLDKLLDSLLKQVSPIEGHNPENLSGPPDERV